MAVKVGVSEFKGPSSFSFLSFFDETSGNRVEIDSKIKFSARRRKKFGTLHEFACHPCAGAMLIFSVSFQF